MSSKETSTPRPFWYFFTRNSQYETGKKHLEPAPFWSPYIAGILLGLTLFGVFFVMGRGLGASGSMNRVMAFLYESVNDDFAHSLSYYKSYFASEYPVIYHYAVFQVLGTLIGGYTSAAVGRRTYLTIDKGPRSDNRSRLIMAFMGGIIMAFGARIARGCTSGQVLTGSATFAVGSIIMFVCFFAGAYLTAYWVRKQWI